MIIPVSGFNTGSVAIDPRKKARSLQFRNNYDESYRISRREEYSERRQRQRDAVWKAVLFIGGATLFILGCFLFSGGKKINK